jgi:hypothetical protein
MKIVADLTKDKLIVGSSSFGISCKVRTLQDKTRKKDEVVLSIPGRFPYDPRPFPAGICQIIGVEWQKLNEKGIPNFDAAVYGPVKIRTNASQKVSIWTLDMDGDYLQETQEQVEDYGYLLHYSESSTTLGCIRLRSPEEAKVLGRLIENILKSEPVELEVVYV